ncbi:MAG: hypothetical protein LBK62_04920 [Treponema sp.]|jgi:hypothetical protein|nr:hypothetical protein [Treponema sp.]
MSKTEKPPVIIIRDALRREIEKRTEGSVTVMYDDFDIPSYMLRIPRFNEETIDSSLGRGVHPAFMVDGKEVEEIFIGQVNATIIDGRAYSIPGERATRSINFDEARESCAKKGKGWHLLNNWEYAALVMHLVKNRNRYFEKEWWDWIDGLKIVDGEIFTLGDNNFELPEKDWPSLGVFFDDIKGSPILNNEITHYTEADPKGIEDDRDNDWVMLDYFSKLEWFKNFHQSQIEKLAQMMIIPSATPVYAETDGPIWVRNYGERLPIRGGSWYDGAGAGLAALVLNDRRSDVSSNIGCRPAFINLKN